MYRIFLYFFLAFFPSCVFANDVDLIHDISKSFNFFVSDKFSLNICFIIFFLTVLPVLLLVMTCFTRLIIVFGLLRNAMGTPYLPSNHILVSLSLFLTFFVMEPTCKKIYNTAYIPFSQKKITIDLAFQKGFKPLRDFMLKQTHKKDLLVFTKLAHIKEIKNNEDIPNRVLIPAFIISEIQTAFKIGVTIFIPFLIIDLLISSVLMSLGMMMVPPSTISLPLKLIIFVISDGWQLLVTSLVNSFRI
ncbi:flagellar type III secretion system pore protein FliP [Buchnera aphidicola]|uniref:flagellar type III secretion system pore protein FliP n=1 Tax=Buchnera aphidicola TaxID=9 RepID=UPI003464B694